MNHDANPGRFALGHNSRTPVKKVSTPRRQKQRDTRKRRLNHDHMTLGGSITVNKEPSLIPSDQSDLPDKVGKMSLLTVDCA
jgi:hypothetical protein